MGLAGRSQAQRTIPMGNGLIIVGIVGLKLAS